MGRTILIVSIWIAHSQVLLKFLYQWLRFFWYILFTKAFMFGPAGIMFEKLIKFVFLFLSTTSICLDTSRWCQGLDSLSIEHFNFVLVDSSPNTTPGFMTLRTAIFYMAVDLMFIFPCPCACSCKLFFSGLIVYFNLLNVYWHRDGPRLCIYLEIILNIIIPVEMRGLWKAMCSPRQ